VPFDVAAVREPGGGFNEVAFREGLSSGTWDPARVLEAFNASAAAGGFVPGEFRSTALGGYDPAMAANHIVLGIRNRSGGAISRTAPLALAVQLQAGMDPSEIIVRISPRRTFREELESGRANSYVQSFVREANGGSWPTDKGGQSRLFTVEEVLRALRGVDWSSFRRGGPVLPNPGVTVFGELSERVPADTAAWFYRAPDGATFDGTARQLERALESALGAENVVGLARDATTDTSYRARVRLLVSAPEPPLKLTTAAGTWNQVDPAVSGSGSDVEEGDEPTVPCRDCGGQTQPDEPIQSGGGGGTGGDAGSGPGQTGDDAPVVDDTAGGGGGGGETDGGDGAAPTGAAGGGPCPGPVAHARATVRNVLAGDLEGAFRALTAGTFGTDPRCWPLVVWIGAAVLVFLWWRSRRR
jgi:hypothetical protein